MRSSKKPRLVVAAQVGTPVESAAPHQFPPVTEFGATVEGERLGDSDTEEIDDLINVLDRAAHDWHLQHGEPAPADGEKSPTAPDDAHDSPASPLPDDEPLTSTVNPGPISADLTVETAAPPVAPPTEVEGGLPCVRADDLPELSDSDRWLIDGLWAGEGVGIVAAAPKSGKTWAVLDIAVSVASGTPCFGGFNVPVSSVGPVLLFAAEDALAQQRFRLDSICRARGIKLEGLPVHIITAARLRLDIERDRQALLATIDAVEPRVLALDCLVRLHALPENDAGAMSELLGWLRAEVNRRRGIAVCVAHHVTKRGGLGGAAMRGSSDLHAWGDSNIYLRKSGATIQMAIEHRSAAAPEPVRLKLVEGDAPHLEVVADGEVVEDRMPPVRDLDSEIVKLVGASTEPMTRERLREKLGVRNATLGAALAGLTERGELRRGPGGWTRCP